MEKPLIIGITGGSGSGKTTFTKQLAFRLGKNCTVLTQDNYYHPIHLQPLDSQGFPNFDLPTSLDLAKFHQDLLNLRNGKTLKLKEYTFNNPSLTASILTIPSTKIILVEGLFIFHLPETEALMDLKLFIEVEDYLKLERRLKRDLNERGYNERDVLYSHTNHVMPSYYQHIEKHKHLAHLVIPNNTGFEKCLEMVGFYINSLL